MKPCRLFALLCALGSAMALSAADAEARASINRNNRSTGPRRLIDRDEDRKDDRKRDEARNTKKQDDGPKGPPSVAKPPATQQPPASQKPPAVAQARPRPRPATTATQRPSSPSKTDEAREAEATKLLEQANAAFDKGTEDDLVAGAGILRQLVADYDGTAAASSGRQQLDLLLGHQDYGPMLLLAEAKELFGAQRYRRAWNKFSELMERFPKSEQAAEARARLDEIVRDDLLKKTAYTDAELEDARLWLLAGNIHFENGRRGEAAAAYRRVIEEYPGCRYALMAEEKLPATRGS